ncbi:hypothetical protein Hsar01_02897 [Haloferula sargassicola]|uniref:Uncharacterized protein n=1 Tax=Haloferula sargassicola TaxID=490096 RepID=A0ABP9UUZ0_9BACT
MARTRPAPSRAKPFACKPHKEPNPRDSLTTSRARLSEGARPYHSVSSAYSVVKFRLFRPFRCSSSRPTPAAGPTAFPLPTPDNGPRTTDSGVGIPRRGLSGGSRRLGRGGLGTSAASGTPLLSTTDQGLALAALTPCQFGFAWVEGRYRSRRIRTTDHHPPSTPRSSTSRCSSPPASKGAGGFFCPNPRAAAAGRRTGAPPRPYRAWSRSRRPMTGPGPSAPGP